MGKGGNGIYFIMLALSFLVPDAIVSEPITVPYIETVERITDSAYAIAGQPVEAKQPRVGGTRTGYFKTSDDNQRRPQKESAT